jgi:hypothetical protein
VNLRSLPHGAVALTGLVALLAGCSGNSAITPAGSAGSLAGTQAIGHTASQAFHTASAVVRADTVAGILADKNFEQTHYSKTNPPGPIPQALMSRNRPHGAGVRATAIKFDQAKIDAKKALNYVFTSDGGTGDINIYDEASLTLLGQGAGYGGYGVAADKKGHVCWGTFSGTIACGNTTVYGWTPTAYLTESAGAALGLAFTSNGDLYATNLGSNVIDHWSAAQVAGCSACSPVSSFGVPALGYAYYLGADGAKLYVDGYDSTFAYSVVGEVNVKSGKFKETVSSSASGFFPGGVAFDKSHTLIWDDQYGYIFSLAKPYTYVTGYIEYDNGTNPVDYTGIALDSKETDLLAANIYYCGSSTCSDAQENSYPLASIGLASASNGDLSDLGIAITPPAKN